MSGLISLRQIKSASPLGSLGYKQIVQNTRPDPLRHICGVSIQSYPQLVFISYS